MMGGEDIDIKMSGFSGKLDIFGCFCLNSGQWVVGGGRV